MQLAWVGSRIDNGGGISAAPA